MSDYKLTFKLKQHTPYIHFQHNHLGATLRASDLKPRIDKYLYVDFQLEKQKYQLTISSTLKEDYPTNSSPGKEPYFGKHKLCRYNSIELKFNTYFNTELDNKIKEILPKVFTCENFGSFGSKGYGCFTDEKQTQSDFQDLLKAKYKTVYYWETTNTSDADIFFQIKYFYALLKAGINIPKGPDKTYYKSLLMQYFLPDIRWEKRGIKKEFNLTAAQNQTGNLDQKDITIPPDETYKVVKPLFGYSTSQKWLSYHKDIVIGFPDKENIKRINSPLFFKVYNDDKNTSARIYFMLRNDAELKNKILPNKPFEYTIGTTTKPFFTPVDFCYLTFLQDVVKEINNSIIVINKGKVDNFIKSFKTNRIKSL